MQVEMQYIDNVAKKLNLSRDEIIRESLKLYLEKIIREIEIDILKIKIKYGADCFEEFEEKYENGEIEEKDSWEIQKFFDLENKKEELEKALVQFR